MWKILMGLIFVCNLFNLKGQDIQAILLKIDGEGIVTRANEIVKLNIPFNFYAHDVVQVVQGSAKILQAEGNEIVLTKGQTYNFAHEKKSDENQIDERLSKAMHQFYVMRDVEQGKRAHVNILPDSFKSAQSSTIFLQWKDMQSLRAAFIMVARKNTSDTLIFEQFPADGRYNFEKELPPGEYHWVINMENDISMKSGSFNVTENTGPCAELKVTDDWSLLNMIACLMEAEYFYDALAYIEYGIEETGENSIFIYLKEQLLRQMRQ